jgi:E3 ubiquitin-protein ligase RAD18
MMREGALRQKLQDIGIPSWGGKDLMKRRHIEWLNIFNSNCDADDRARRSKRELVKELEEWENTQGGRAREAESKVMRKDFDGSWYAKANKSGFDELIERARRKRATPKAGEGAANDEKEEGQATEGDAPTEPGTSAETPDATLKPAESPRHADTLPNGLSGMPIHGSAAAPHEQPTMPNHAPEAANATNAHAQPDEVPLGLQNPLGSTERKLPMFALPEDPIRDVDMGAR